LSKHVSVAFGQNKLWLFSESLDILRPLLP
jgi:hypothetical protein